MVPMDAASTMLAQVRASHPALRDLDNDNLITYLPLVVPNMLAPECKRADSILLDPLSVHIAADVGDILSAFRSNNQVDTENFVILGAYLLEQVLLTRNPRIHQIVQFGPSTDTFAYWMQELADCVIYELQPNRAVVSELERAVTEAQVKPVTRECHVILADASDETWRDLLLAEGFDPCQPTLWLVGSLISYQFEADGGRLLELIDEISSPGSQLYADMCSGHRFNVQIGDGPEVTLHPGANSMHGNDGTVFRPLAEWYVELLVRRDSEMQYYGSMWNPDAERLQRLCVTDANLVTLGPFYMVRFTKGQAP